MHAGQGAKTDPVRWLGGMDMTTCPVISQNPASVHVCNIYSHLHNVFAPMHMQAHVAAESDRDEDGEYSGQVGWVA
jgi:hypothetical protein